MSKEIFIHAENNHNSLSTRDVKLFNPPKPEEIKVVIWNKELCNGAEWNDFLECVEGKSEENAELKKQLAITEKALDLACDKIEGMFESNYQNAWFYGDDGKSIIMREEFEEYFKTKSKEMLKNEK